MDTRICGRARATSGRRSTRIVGYLVTGALALAAPAAWADTLPLPDGGSLSYSVAGSGAPLVLIHGGNLDRGMWNADVAVFARTRRVVTYDVRPYGQSKLGTAPFSSVEDLRALLDYLKIPRADIVGLSLGGRIGIDFALAWPERVGKLVLAGPGLSGFDWSPDPRVTAMVEAAKAGKLAEAVALWLKHPYMAPAMENPGVAEEIRRLAARNEHIWALDAAVERMPEPPAMTRLEDLSAPTLVLIGERDVPDIHRIGDLLAARARNVKRIRIAGAGHMLNLERPEDFRREVLAFLDSPRRAR